MNLGALRTRWAAIGAAVAVTLGAGSLGIVNATSPSGASAYVPITPCRLVDTRPAPDTVGSRATPLGPDETFTVTARGSNGDCTGGSAIPTEATGLQLNVTAIGATSPTYLTVWASDAAQPTASNLNPLPGQGPVPNAVTTGLSADGKIAIYNRAGNVDVIVDIVGYYTDHDHDDRYYTEAEVDALLTATRSIAVHEATNGSIALQLNTPQATESVTLAAPVAGTVIVNANAYASDTGAGSTGVRCSISDDTSIDFDYLLYAVGDFTGETRPLAGTRGFAVGAGETFTANLMCDVNGGAGNVQDRSMSAIFVPG
jgi:hypothetical protein